MFFYRKQSPTGYSLQLLASYRPPGGGSPRHRVVASLGDAPIPEAWYESLAGLIEERLGGQQPLLPAGLPAAGLTWADQILKQIERQGGWPPAAPTRATGRQPPDEVVDGVLVDRVEHSHATVLGPLVVGLHAWDQLGLDGLLAQLGFTSAQRQAAAALVLARLAEPLSEHGLVTWLPQSSFPDLLGESVLRGGWRRYYQAGDKLRENRDRIERHLRERTASHYGLERAIFLYDLTNFHFEGVCAANPKARRGRNKQKRDDCPQVVVGMVFDEFGFELLHRTFPGNQADAKTLPEIVEVMRAAVSSEELSSQNLPTVVLDGGLGTGANLAELRARGFHYLVNDRRTKRGALLEQFRQDGFHPVCGREEHEQVLVRHLDLPKQQDTPAERLVLCKSAGRRQKELAIRSQAEMRLRADLEKLTARLVAGRLKNAAGAERALGRVLARHPRAARFYQTQIAKRADHTLHLTWLRRDEYCRDEEDLAGCYVLRTDRRDLEGEELWRLYMTLCRAEDGFQTLKSDLGLRPGFHQLEHRVDAHVFVTVLAYQLLRFLLHRLEARQDRRSWFTLRQVLSTHCYATIHLPTRDGRLYRLRRPGMPEQCQWQIYRSLGIHSLHHLPRTKSVVHPGTSRGGFEEPGIPVVTQKLDR
jgi:transposase